MKTVISFVVLALAFAALNYQGQDAGHSMRQMYEGRELKRGGGGSRSSSYRSYRSYSSSYTKSYYSYTYSSGYYIPMAYTYYYSYHYYGNAASQECLPADAECIADYESRQMVSTIVWLVVISLFLCCGGCAGACKHVKCKSRNFR